MSSRTNSRVVPPYRVAFGVGRLLFPTLAAMLVLHLSLHAQEKKEPPKQFTNSIGMKFVWIPPGSFVMGSPKEEKQRNDSEAQHKVTLTRGFYMGVYLVTTPYNIASDCYKLFSPGMLTQPLRKRQGCYPRA